MNHRERRFQVFNVPYIRDEKGGLVPFEFGEDFPFLVKRSYFVTAHDGGMRGGHAHKREEEVFFAASGSMIAVVEDAQGIEEILLNAPNKALWIKTGCWHEFKDFSENAVLGAFSSTHYLPGDQNYEMDRSVFRNTKGSL
jgi:dTDP-4-dehydrorhamnose 3,5-epimerase-like enzyme